jgi:MarR family transcriptional regulator, organic hydroperoxide resistance regulator
VTSLDSEPSLAYLAHIIVGRLESHTSQWIKGYGLKVRGARILLRLATSDNQRVTELAEMTGIEVSALSHMLTRLDHQGYIKRSKPSDAADDNRSVVIGLTAKGRRVANELLPKFRAYDEHSMSGFSREERRALKTALMRVLKNLEEAEASNGIAARRTSRAAAIR